MSVTPEEFVRTWQSSDSTAEVAEKLGMTHPAAYQRSRVYREKGIHLKEMPPGNGRPYRLDPDALNSLIEELASD